MKKLLITGCEGLLGQNLLAQVNWKTTQVKGFDLKPDTIQGKNPSFHYRMVDLTDRQALLTAVRECAPDVIVNAAAMTAVDRCETDPATCYRVNTEAVESLAIAAREQNSRLIQISTDYVFNGTSGPYREEDTPTPLSIYGQSKLESEKIVLALPESLGMVVRTVVLYGHGQNLTSSFVTWLLDSLRAGKPVRIVEDQISNVTLASDLAAGLLQIIDSDLHGILHYASRDIESRYDFAKRAARHFDLDESLISPIPTSELGQPAPRPLRGGLRVEKAEKLLGRKMMTIDESLRKYRLEER